MLRLSDTDVQYMIRRSARDFLSQECTFDRLNAIARGEADSSALWRQFSDLGWPGMLVSGDYGGTDSGFDDVAALCEELGRAIAPGPFFSSSVIAASLIANGGKARLRDRLLPQMATGEHITVPAVTEESYGWNPAQITTRADREGERLKISGVKQYVPDADVADTLICAVRTGRDSADISLVVVDARDRDVRIQPMPGWFSQPMFEVTLDGVTVGPEDILGEIDLGWRVLEPVLDQASILLSAYISGAMERAYEMTIGYAEARVQFGQAIARFQRVQDHLVNMRNWTDASVLATKEAVGTVIDGGDDVSRAASLAKLLSSRGFFQLCDAAHNVHAGIGSDKRYGLHLFSRASRTYFHYLGSPDHHVDRLTRLLEH